MAALHGVVLAAVHNEDAVDLDIYGAFQLCAVGVLVAPVSAALSRTYFTNPGRNAIVGWALLVVTGLVSLAVEFYRVSGEPTDCYYDDDGQPLDPNRDFPYENASCGLTCDTDLGPFSSIRGGSADNIYVIPIPYALTFNACIMLTAACCIPAILLIAWMMVTSSHTNWTRRFGEQASLTLKVPVKLFDSESGMPTLDELRQVNSNLNRIGVIGTQAYRIRRQSLGYTLYRNSAQEPAEHLETAPEDDATSSNSGPSKGGIAWMLHDLHEKSSLSVYDFELNGRPLQIREMKLAANVDNFARQVYAALRDLENEHVDIICVESIDVDEGTPEDRVMKWLRNEEQTEKGAPHNKQRKERTRSPGAMILLGLFSLAVLAILVAGERNLFSKPVNYQTEPMPNVGQWAPVAGTILVVAGSIYVLVAEGMRKERRRMRADGDGEAEEDEGPLDRVMRGLVRRLIRLNDFFDAPSWLFDHSDFQKGQKKYPLVPGEQHRNERLAETIEEYEPSRGDSESDRSAAPSRRSFAGSTASRQRSRESSRAADAEPEVPPPVRKRTLTLPEVDRVPSRRRRSTHNSPPGTPLEPIVPHDANHPTIVFSLDDEEAVEDRDVIR